MTDFRIDVEALTERGDRLEFEAPPAWWAERRLLSATASDSLSEPPAEVIAKPVRFALRAARVGNEVRLDGDMTGSIELECSRCGKRYSHALRESYRLRLSPSQGRSPVDPEGERALAERGLCLGEELEAGWYRGPVIRLDDFFAEVVALAMPIQPLCDEGCPGICFRCGAPREAGASSEGAAAGGERGSRCDCREETVESPFAVLAQLKER